VLRNKIAGALARLWRFFHQPQDFASLSAAHKNFRRIVFFPLAGIVAHP
jgi:hypothetical protein